MAIKLLGPTSSSELNMLGCPRKFKYRYVDKLVPKTMSLPLATGIFWHKCAAAGYAALREGDSQWLRCALDASYESDPVDRDGIALGLEPDAIEAMRHMLEYYWEFAGRFDEFKQIHIIDEEAYFSYGGWNIRITIDLAYTAHDGRFFRMDHKTSSDISEDLAFLPLDLQTHLYYYGANLILERRPDEFIHNFVRRFDFASDQMVGPVSWVRGDHSQPYLKTRSGRPATRSSDPNDYLRRSRTPLTTKQLNAYETELATQLAELRYHQVSGVYPRRAQKGYMGCSGCAYYGPCSTEMDGNELNPAAMAEIYTVMP
jgi:hypothetical protein